MICKVALEGVYRQQGEVWVGFSITQEEYVHELSDLKVGGCDILHNIRKELRDVAAFGDELENYRESK